MTKPKMKVKSKGCKPTRNKKYCSSRRATRRSRCKSAIIVVISAHLATNFRWLLSPFGRRVEEEGPGKVTSTKLSPKGSRIQRSLLPQAATGKMQKQILEARFGDVGIGHHYISFSRQTHRISQ